MVGQTDKVSYRADVQFSYQRKKKEQCKKTHSVSDWLTENVDYSVASLPKIVYASDSINNVYFFNTSFYIFLDLFDVFHNWYFFQTGNYLLKI